MVNNSALGFKRLLVASLVSAGLVGCGGGTESTNTVIDPTIAEPPSAVADVPESDWALVWSDEFDGSAIDSSKWTHEINCEGGGNQERQCYTDDPANSFVSDGILNIVAMPTPADSGLPLPYTSARLNTRYKADFTYGRFEMRAKMPFGQGTWPAFWMLPTDEVYGGWPRSGEIDIMEAVNLKTVDAEGNVFGDIVGTTHYGNVWPDNDFTHRYYTPASNPADGFHTYAVEWQEGEIRWYMDGYLYATQRESVVRTLGDGTPVGLSHRGWFVPQFNPVTGEMENLYGAPPFNQAFHLILNLAIGGNFPENTNNGGVDASALENGQSLQVDWVRVYECSTDPMTGRGCESVRPGYDSLDDALLEGEAPSPSPPIPDVATPITIFSDGENPDWPLWDCCGGTEPQVVMDEDATRGAVAEFEILNNDGTVLGFNSRLGESGEAFNASAMLSNGSLKFDMKVVSPPSAATTWIVKVEADNNTSAAEIPISTSSEGVNPVTGEWQTYTFPLSFLSDQGLDVGAIDVIMIFPAWQTGEGAIYRVDNVTIAPDNGGGGGAPSPELVLFENEMNPNWTLWDCCGGTTPTEEMDDEGRGLVAEFQILDNNGTVLGFNGRENGASFNAGSIISQGVLEFDMKVVSPPTSETTWLLKVEADGNTSSAEVPLNTSTQGVDPVTGEWQTYTFPLLALADAGLDVSLIDVVMIFPAWQTGEGAIYRVDNARIYDPNATSGGGGGAPSGPLLQVFAEGVNEGWPLWDCCGGTTPTVEMDDADHGAVAEFQILDNNGTVLGFFSRDTGSPFNAGSIITTGVLQFEMKVNNPPSGETTWLLKVEANGNTSSAEVPLNTSQEGADPVTGEWQTYTFDLLSLADAGLDVTGIDVIMVFPAWQTGEGAIYRIDNMYIGNPSDIAGGSSGGSGGGDGGSGSSEAALTIFADQVNEGWPLWDCCGGTTPTVEMVDGYGAVAQFQILDNNGTVLGFFSRDTGTPFDASPYIASGKLQFDMRVVNPPSGETTWLLKVEANGNTSAAEVALNTSNQGVDPVVGEWQTYSFDLLSLLDAGLDVSGIDVVMVFPAWQTGEGAIYQLDNVVVTTN